MLEVLGPLTEPTAHGGSAADAFDVVIPSLPGYGFSGKPTTSGWDPDHIARHVRVAGDRDLPCPDPLSGGRRYCPVDGHSPR